MKLKPYPKYKGSGVPWLGDVPEHWEVFRIGSQFTERKEKVSDKDFAPLSVTKKGILPQLDTVAKSKDGDNRKKVCSGDFVINSRSDRKGSSGISSHTGSVSVVNTVLTPIALNHRYVHNLFRSYLFQEEFYRVGRGIVADLWSTKYEDMRTIMISIPPFDEQQQIARYLDWKTAQINKFIRNKRRLIQLLKEQKQNIINQAVTKGINPNVEMKDSGVEWLGEIPKHWEVRKLKTIAKIKASGVDKHSRENEIPIQLCNYTDVYKNDKITDSMDFMKATATKEEISNFELVAGDVIITKDSEIWHDIAVPAYVPNSLQNVICAYHLSLIRPRQEYIKGDFLHHCFLAPSLAYQFKVTAAGVTRFGLSQGAIKSALFVVPPIDEQQEIVTYLEKETALIDKTISRTEREIELIQEYRSRLISDVVTGKLDVRGVEIPDFEPVEADLELEEDEEAEGELMEEEFE